jgi:hypothetical protein
MAEPSRFSLDRGNPAPGLSRRDCGRVLLAVVGGLGAVAMGCRGDGHGAHACADTSTLTPAERELRATLGYVDRSADEARSCKHCQQWSAVAASPCGRCTVVRGPIDPEGRCKKWAAREGM